MGKKKRGNKTKMMFATFMGLALIAAGAKVFQLIQDKMDKNKNNNHEDCCG